MFADHKGDVARIAEPKRVSDLGNAIPRTVLGEEHFTVTPNTRRRCVFAVATVPVPPQEHITRPTEPKSFTVDMPETVRFDGHVVRPFLEFGDLERQKIV